MKANENHLKTKNENPTGKPPIKKEEIKMKKTIIATLMAGTMVLGMTACGTKPTETTVALTSETTVETTEATPAETTPAETTPVETPAETTSEEPEATYVVDGMSIPVPKTPEFSYLNGSSVGNLPASFSNFNFENVRIVVNPDFTSFENGDMPYYTVVNANSEVTISFDYTGANGELSINKIFNKLDGAEITEAVFNAENNHYTVTIPASALATVGSEICVRINVGTDGYFIETSFKVVEA